MDDSAASPDAPPDRRRANLRPPWTPEEQLEAARKGGLARKGKRWTWEEGVRRALSRRLPNGERTREAVARALVEKALEGDTRAVELTAKLTGWRPETVKRHEHTVSRELVIRAKPATPIEPASAPELPQASDAPRPASEPTSDNA